MLRAALELHYPDEPLTLLHERLWALSVSLQLSCAAICASCFVKCSPAKQLRIWPTRDIIDRGLGSNHIFLVGFREQTSDGSLHPIVIRIGHADYPTCQDCANRMDGGPCIMAVVARCPTAVCLQLGPDPEIQLLAEHRKNATAS